MSALVRDAAEEVVLRGLKNEEILRSLSAIRAPHSQAIVLAYFYGQTCSEVARTLNLSVPAVKSCIRDGFSALRQSLDHPGKDEQGML